jgi:hypothetical protein
MRLSRPKGSRLYTVNEAVRMPEWTSANGIHSVIGDSFAESLNPC